jgi:hypothetical protein
LKRERSNSTAAEVVLTKKRRICLLLAVSHSLVNLIGFEMPLMATTGDRLTPEREIVS